MLANHFDVIILGGGAAGIFAALAVAEKNSNAKVLLLERGLNLLGKVKISGGGRCNVTHACYDPSELVKNYPRGGKELIGPFNRFSPKETIDWFHKRGVRIKEEKDGRCFPTTDSSQTIIDCLLKEASYLGVEIRVKQKVNGIEKKEAFFKLALEGEELYCKFLILATGSQPLGHAYAAHFGHTIVPCVPSLFTFNVPGFSLADISGVSVPSAKLKFKGSPLSQIGPLLVTHWGFSGPCALKLSAWAARWLHEKSYVADLEVDWLNDQSLNAICDHFYELRKKNPSQKVIQNSPFQLPKRLWGRFMQRLSLSEELKMQEISNAFINQLATIIKKDLYHVSGKSTNKEEFVTCGGVSLKEIDFKHMQSKLVPGLYFAGEILDIDGITGGFNFQNAWTSGWLAGLSIASLA